MRLAARGQPARGAGKASRTGELLPGVLAGLGLEDSLRAARVLEAWPRAVGERIARFVRVASLRDGVLHLEADSSVWLQEIQLQSRRVRERLAEECGEDWVRDLKLVFRHAP